MGVTIVETEHPAYTPCSISSAEEPGIRAECGLDILFGIESHVHISTSVMSRDKIRVSARVRYVKLLMSHFSRDE